MPIAYKIDPTLGLLYYMALGYCPIAKLTETERIAFYDPERLPNMKIIINTMNAEFDLSTKDLHEFIQFNQPLHKNHWALEQTAVLTRNRFAEGLSDTIHFLAGDLPIKLKIFHTLADAAQWLDLADHIERIEEIQAELKAELE
ncbi:MAG: hypothetical protein FJ031_08840 [Chloroflexi bacterium]|nr:hypothetical protein [Chloroflexota bacterium]